MTSMTSSKDKSATAKTVTMETSTMIISAPAVMTTKMAMLDDRSTLLVSFLRSIAASPTAPGAIFQVCCRTQGVQEKSKQGSWPYNLQWSTTNQCILTSNSNAGLPESQEQNLQYHSAVTESRHYQLGSVIYDSLPQPGAWNGQHYLELQMEDASSNLPDVC